MRFETFKFESVTSTNDTAINLIKEEQKEIGCVYANSQTKGRGTHGRKWVSDRGNLFGSIFFPLKNLTFFEIFFNFFLKYFLGFLIFLCQDLLFISTLTFIIGILLISFYNFCYQWMSHYILMVKIYN